MVKRRMCARSRVPWLRMGALVGLLLCAAPAAFGETAGASAVSAGDTAWLLVSAALVMLMTPGLAFFYGGLVRRKNVLSVLMQCFAILCVVSIQWYVLGYSLAFGPDVKGIVGNLSWAGLNGVGAAPDPLGYAPTVPHQAFMMFQMMFAVITPALIIGAFAERMRFSSFCVFTVLWATLIYDPVAHWVWGSGGWLHKMGALDFAGGTVVHVNAGLSALAAAIVLGRRQGYPEDVSPPHNLPFAVLGAALLWFGWFGFNAGSALTAGGLAASAFTATHLATAAAGMTWCLMDYLKHRRATTLGMITGAVAGLVAVTPASGFVSPTGAVLVGIGAGVFPWLAVTYAKTRFSYDDSLDAFGVHGIGGIWGALATGLWASKAVNDAGANGLFYGNPRQLLTQAVAVAATIVFSFVGSLVLFKIVDATMGLRVSDHQERVGLDLTQHMEAAYTQIE
jgi:Amt family ammonium transporter